MPTEQNNTWSAKNILESSRLLAPTIRAALGILAIAIMLLTPFRFILAATAFIISIIIASIIFIVLYPSLAPWGKSDPRTWDLSTYRFGDHRLLFRRTNEKNAYLGYLLKGLLVLWGIIFVAATIYNGNSIKAAKYATIAVASLGFPILIPMAIAVFALMLALVATPAGWYAMLLGLQIALGYPVKNTSRILAKNLLAITTIGIIVFGVTGWTISQDILIPAAVAGGWIFTITYFLLLLMVKLKHTGKNSISIHSNSVRDMKKWISIDYHEGGTPGLLEIVYSPLLMKYETRFYPIRIQRDNNGRIILPKTCFIYRGELIKAAESVAGYTLIPAFKKENKYVCIVPSIKKTYLKSEKHTIQVKVGKSKATAYIKKDHIEIYANTDGRTTVKLTMVLPKVGIEVPIMVAKSIPFVQVEVPTDYVLEPLTIEIPNVSPPDPNEILKHIPSPKKHGFILVGVPILIRLILETPKGKSVDEAVVVTV